MTKEEKFIEESAKAIAGAMKEKKRKEDTRYLVKAEASKLNKKICC